MGIEPPKEVLWKGEWRISFPKAELLWFLEQKYGLDLYTIIDEDAVSKLTCAFYEVILDITVYTDGTYKINKIVE